MKQKEDVYTLDLFDGEVNALTREQWAKKSVCFIEVCYVWNDQPDLVRHGIMAVTPNNTSIEDFDRLLDMDDVFYVLEGGHPIIGDQGEFTVLTSEVVA